MCQSWDPLAALTAPLLQPFSKQRPFSTSMWYLMSRIVVTSLVFIMATDLLCLCGLLDLGYSIFRMCSVLLLCTDYSQCTFKELQGGVRGNPLHLVALLSLAVLPLNHRCGDTADGSVCHICRRPLEYHPMKTYLSSPIEDHWGDHSSISTENNGSSGC